MAVRNPTRHGPRRVVINQDPTTARGKRRANNTQEYQDNCKARSQQSSPGGRNSGDKKPFKGPANRGKSIHPDRWRAYMSGRSKDL